MHNRVRIAKGFTLVETLCAGVLMGLAGIVVGTAISQAIQSQILARDYQRAAELLDRTLTKIDLIGPERVVREGPVRGQFEPPHEQFAWQAEIDSQLSGHLYELNVTIFWQSAGTLRQVQASTLLNDAPLSRNPLLMWDQL